MRRWKVLAAIAVTVVLVVTAGLMGFRGGQTGGDAVSLAPVTVDPTRGTVQQTVVAPGRVVGTKQMLVGMGASGRLEAIAVRPGSVVKRGDEMARLDTEPLEEALAAAQQEQARQLIEGFGPLPTREVKRAKSDLAASTLTAPFDGVVLEVSATPGETVAAGMGFILLADPSAVEVRTTVIEEDLPLVQVGQPVELFFDAQPDTATAGRVARIVPRRVLGEDRPLYHVYLEMESVPEGVVSGMTADASIVVAHRTGVLRLPRSLVRSRFGGTATVEVWAGGRAQARTVDVGLRGDVNVEIVAGLREDEPVVAE